MSTTILNRQIIDLYRKRARNYDFTANLYYLLGYKEWAYRRQAVAALRLKPGDTVIEIGCGTGLNFSLYQEDIGPQGKIIGIDLTDAMLIQAQKRTQYNDWENVDLVQADARDFEFPTGVNAIISTYALSLVPESSQVLEKAVRALATSGRLALLELQVPQKWPGWLVRLGIWLIKPFAVTDEWLVRRPWESLKQTMFTQLSAVTITEMYLGVTYVIAGQKTSR